MCTLPFIVTENRERPEASNLIHSERFTAGKPYEASRELKPLGRPPLNGQAMTNAERQKRHREKRKAERRQLEIF